MYTHCINQNNTAYIGIIHSVYRLLAYQAYFYRISGKKVHKIDILFNNKRDGDNKWYTGGGHRVCRPARLPSPHSKKKKRDYRFQNCGKIKKAPRPDGRQGGVCGAVKVGFEFWQAWP